ncbi:MAG: division/cell wall cluster transcriptional repressor MraZ [Nitrospirae bacterium]|nr:division/cell wall cluster transcriptional repressor MraZ [Nitrospirota bacterium]
MDSDGFIGRYNLRADDKGRVVVPVSFRETFKRSYGPKIFVTCAVRDKCLHIFPDTEWRELMAKVKEMPKAKESVKFFIRKVVSSAFECEIDKQGRLLMPPALREDAGISLSGEIIIAGATDRLEVWDRNLWVEKYRDIDDSVVAGYEQELADWI